MSKTSVAVTAVAAAGLGILVGSLIGPSGGDVPGACLDALDDAETMISLASEMVTTAVPAAIEAAYVRNDAGMKQAADAIDASRVELDKLDFYSHAEACREER